MKTVLNVAKVTDDSGAIILSNQVLTEIRQNVVVKKRPQILFFKRVVPSCGCNLNCFEIETEFFYPSDETF